MQQHLLHSKIHPINNIINITNYIILELDQPLHTFNYTILQKQTTKRPTITIHRTHPKKTITTLNEIKHQLDPDTLMISDTTKTVDITKIIKKNNSEISKQTTKILLKTTHFEFLNNHKTNQLLKLHTKTNKHFDKQLDPKGTLPTTLHTAQLMVTYANNTLEPITKNLYPKHPKTIVLTLDPDYVQHVIKIKLNEAKMIHILTTLEFKINSKNTLQVTVPSHHQDVQILTDLIKKITRIHGYNNIPPSLIHNELPPQHPNLKLNNTDHIHNLLTSLKLNKIITYSIINPKNNAHLQIQNAMNLNNYIPIVNPLTQEHTHLRRNLIPKTLNTTHSNLHFINRITTFEINNVFHPKSKQILPKKPQHLNLLLAKTQQNNS